MHLYLSSPCVYMYPFLFLILCMRAHPGRKQHSICENDSMQPLERSDSLPFKDILLVDRDWMITLNKRVFFYESPYARFEVSLNYNTRC
mmetsp:Transcript_3047/g.4390  ORF Transcript_3047/g.4390 Transcript_3047/m.4390 type:complete len:89 (+) Transcript_3047:264-530(+)